LIFVLAHLVVKLTIATPKSVARADRTRLGRLPWLTGL
jgi:hypothetical protein